MIETTSLACVFAVLTATGPVETTPDPQRPDGAPISLGLSLQPLIDHFNAGRGKTRFVAIVSSTCPACVFGAEAVKASVLDAYPDADIQVSVVWIDMLPSDNEGAALQSSAIFGDPPDPRLKQFHDPNKRTGRAFARDLLYEGGGVAWDIYLYYDKLAVWNDTLPEPVEWYHQLGGGRRADPAKFRPGEKLPTALREAMGRVVKRELADTGPRLELLSFPGCPTATVLHANLVEAAARLGLVTSRIEAVNLGELEAGDPRRGWGSPTVLVDGVDLFGKTRPADEGMSCRIYPDGKAPTTEQITARLESRLRTGD